MACDVKMNS